MEFQVLGPLVVTADGGVLPLRSAKQRILLAVLLRYANAPVSQHRLMEALWEVPPASAAENLRLYVYQLRRALNLGDRISRHPTGYALTVRAGELDSDRFSDLAADGERALAEGDPEKAGELLADGLALWRGPAYADLADTPVIRQIALRLEETRLHAVEARITADLALGRHAAVVGELISLADAHPYRESLRAKLMIALYGSGRQAEALEVYRRTRELLAEELGIEPGAELRGLHETVLLGESPARLVDVPVKRRSPRNDAECPYRGLMAFQPEHRAWFFGRDRLIEVLERRVDQHPVVGVFGASGSGKSSLLRAGLIGRLADDPRWRSVLLTPTARPMDALAAALAELTGKDQTRLRAELAADPAHLDIAVRTELAAGPEDVRAVLVVDQFEELFTLCGDDGERTRFVGALLDAARGPHRRTKVVLGIRADFLAHITQHPELVTALADEATVLVGPPSSTDLREIVLRPATMTGQSVAADLLATVLADVESEPGALPLLSHALVETWRRRDGGTLTLSDYRAGGGVRGAIAQSAEREYDDLDAEGQSALRRIVLRLTAFGDGTEDTRRPIDRGELAGVAAPAVVDRVLDRLVTARLVVVDEDTVEIAHEVLIRAWPRLQRWLSDDRARLLVHRRLTAAAHTWAELDRDEGALYRGSQLATALAWVDDHAGELNDVEEAFLRASRERAEGERTATRRRTRLLKRLVSIMGVLLLLAVTGRWDRGVAEPGSPAPPTRRPVPPDGADLPAAARHRARPGRPARRRGFARPVPLEPARADFAAVLRWADRGRRGRVHPGRRDAGVRRPGGRRADLGRRRGPLGAQDQDRPGRRP
ncbi:AfsR/SARP family transcriptional regulator [Saccharothrix deserti]|uniref:AfsR/SARP family transcriptional regulator n=1 Tax=Saccharothrix deserti TaxID=2593674 RepID=UPI00131C23CA|nr:AfsR/SARP family transcriptional regulator [Saccharothrix deserti]